MPGIPGLPPELAGMLGGFSAEGMAQMFAQLAAAMQWEGGPVNWDIARDVARQQVTGADRSVGAGERSAVIDSLRLADLWLDQATSFPSGVTTPTAWSRAEWIEGTIPVWTRLVEPVAGSMSSALGSVLPPEMAPMLGPMLPMLQRMSGAAFGAQVGQGLGHLAAEVLSGSEIGIPLAPAGVGVLLPANVTAFATGLGLPTRDVLLFLALREAARARLFAHVPWLRQHLIGAVEAYAAGVNVDVSALEEAVRGMDVSDPAALQQAMESGLFEPKDTPEQKAALDRLETALALVEGWVAHIVATAAADRLPGASALAETIRRRRAAGGPAELTFQNLVGLQLRPRRLREAEVLWQRLTAARGADERDQVWSHPDLMPTSSDLDSPDRFVSGAAVDDFDAAFRDLVAGLEAGPADTAADEGITPEDPEDKGNSPV
jgi:putative hydrolase